MHYRLGTVAERWGSSGSVEGLDSPLAQPAVRSVGVKELLQVTALLTLKNTKCMQ